MDIDSSSSSYATLSEDDDLSAGNLFSSSSSSSSSPSSSAHLVNISLHCPLLITPPPILNMVLDCMDDLTAIRYLSSCRSLHAGYHQYPLKQAMSEWKFREATQLEKYFDRRTSVSMYAIVLLLASIAMPIVLLVKPSTPRVVSLSFFGVFSAIVFCLSCYIVWVLLLRRRVDCCESGRLGMWRRRYLMPRVTRLTTAPRDARFLAYLQHLTELTIAYDKRIPFGKKHPLPHSLRTLRLQNSPDLTLTADILPPRLTSLSLGAVQNMPLPAGVLPPSLTSLHLMHGFDIRFGMEVGVLPDGLRKLELAEWTLPLSRIALPSSLIELSIRWLSDKPLPILPPQLEVLCIGGAFNQPLTDVLPSSLRVLELVGHYGQPFNADVFASIPQLEELHLGDHGATRHLVASMLPRTLKVLRAGKQHSLVMDEASDLPPHLHLLILPTEWNLVKAEHVTMLEQLGQVQGFTVVLE